MKYKRKETNVEAIMVKDALKAAGSCWSDLPQWLIDLYENGNIIFANGYVKIHYSNPEIGQPDDWIIYEEGVMKIIRAEEFEDLFEKEGECRKCDGIMKKGTALQNTITWSDDFGGESKAQEPPRGVTISENGPPKMVSCLKCNKCGYSIGKRRISQNG